MFVQISLRKHSFVTMSVAFFLLLAVVKQEQAGKTDVTKTGELLFRS